MKRFFNFIYRFRGFFTFLILEIFCFYLIVRNNKYQSSVFFSSANFLAANLSNTANDVEEYFLLKTNNRLLAEENAQLKKELEELKSQSSTSYRNIDIPAQKTDTTDSLTNPYEFITAKVINNSTRWRNNTLTLNKGKNHGIQPGMGVVGDNGIVGKIKYVSKRFAVVTSLLHSGFTISSRISDKVEVCTTEWDGVDPQFVKIRYVPRHHQIEPGDTVMTSGYNALFPSNYVIGVIRDVELTEGANFYDITAELINDFTTLSYVHVIKNKIRAEKDSLENISL